MESLKLKLLKFLLGGKITIREANKYLDEVVEELKLKHEKVTHEDFDKDLEEITGIRWKQVKNYKNHPNPGQEIQDNSKVKTFILERRRHNKAHIFKRSGVLLLTLVIIGLVLYRIFLPREIVKFVSIKEGTASIPQVTEAKIKLGIPGLADEIKLGTHKDKFSLGPCRTVQVSNTVCTHQMSGPQKFDVTLFFTADYLTRVALMTQDKSLFEKFVKEIIV